MTTLEEIYYNPSLGLRGRDNLYRKAHELGLKVTQKEVGNFLKSQELHQVIAPQKPNTIPLYAPYPFARVQLDLLDVSNEIPSKNDNVRYIMCLIDVVSRYGFIRTLKTKSEAEVFNAFKSIVDEIDKKFHVTIARVDSDNEPSFLSHVFRNYCQQKGIEQHLSEVGDYKSKGVVERWNRTLRELIARYRTAYQTNRYVDILNEIVEGYNNTYHSFLKTSPVTAVIDPLYYHDVFSQRYWESMKSTIYKHPLKPGDKVRLLVKRKTFDKSSSMIRWTVTAHQIEEIIDHKYKVSNRVGLYKRDELKKVDEVEENPKLRSTFLLGLQGKRIEDTEENIRQHKARQTARRRLTREGL